jgi:hypothetical protein
MDRERKSGWLLGVMAAMLVSVITFGLLYVNRQVAASEQRDCDTLRADILAIESAGRLTNAGVSVTEARRLRYAQIHCKPHLPPPDYEIISPTTRPSR